MQHVKSVDGTTVSYERYGSGPPLVLVHGAFSDQVTNWQECKDLLAEHFTVYAIARRGRGETSVTQGHSVADEVADVVAVLRHIAEPVFLLGHSHGAICALDAAAQYPEGIRKLVLYEPPDPPLVKPDELPQLEQFAASEDWDGLVEAFMQILQVPAEEIAEIKTTPFWSVWTADAKASMNEIRAFAHYNFEAEQYRTLTVPVQLLIDSESPRDAYATDDLAAVLPDVRITTLEGTAHEGMTMVPERFVEKVSEFLLGVPAVSGTS
jgi:pimeloyl-ACP methyl ester carboxylesterase